MLQEVPGFFGHVGWLQNTSRKLPWRETRARGKGGGGGGLQDMSSPITLVSCMLWEWGVGCVCVWGGGGGLGGHIICQISSAVHITSQRCHLYLESRLHFLCGIALVDSSLSLLLQNKTKYSSCICKILVLDLAVDMAAGSHHSKVSFSTCLWYQDSSAGSIPKLQLLQVL